MHTRVRSLRMMLLIISMMACVISPMHGQNRGQVTATADPEVICAGESSTLHAEAIVSSPIIDFETGNFSQANFNTTGSNVWVISTTNPYEGTYCMKSNCYHVNNGESSIEATVDVPSDGFMGFYVKVSSENNYDKFRFYIDNVEIGSALSGEVPYTYKEYTVTAGTHTYLWKYKKDVYGDSGEDCVYIDNITLFSQNSLNPTLPAEPTYDFNSGFQNWTRIDADGDGYNWKMSNNYGHSGSKCVMSESYSSGALFPNNYLVSPRIELGGLVTFYACAYSTYYSDEHFGLAVSTTNNTNAAAFTIIQEWTMTAKGTSKIDGLNDRYGNWYQFTVDISNYAGQTGYVAIRHFDCSDQWALYVDDIYFYDAPSNPGGTTGDVTYSWTPVDKIQGNANQQNVTTKPLTETTTYTVTATDQNGTVIGTADQTVVVYQDPLLSISTNTGSAEICEGDTIVLYVTVGGGTDVKVGDIVCTDGSLVKPSDWPCGKTAKGIVFYVDATGQHGWAVDLGEITQTMQWSTQNQDITGLQNQTIWMNAILDLDGNANTQTIMSAGDNTKYPAAWAAHENGGYLPSVGQLNILFGEYFAVNTSLELVGGVQITNQNNAYLWSSTPNANNKVWIVTVDKGYFQAEMKSSNKSVRAIFDF